MVNTSIKWYWEGWHFKYYSEFNGS